MGDPAARSNLSRLFGSGDVGHPAGTEKGSGPHCESSTTWSILVTGGPQTGTTGGCRGQSLRGRVSVHPRHRFGAGSDYLKNTEVV